MCLFYLLIVWQECYDDVSGFIYYWNTQTNKVTWEKPEYYETTHIEESQGVYYIMIIIISLCIISLILGII